MAIELKGNDTSEYSDGVQIGGTAAIANDTSRGVEIRGGGRIAEFGLLNNAGIANPCGYIRLPQHGANNRYLWFDNAGTLRTGTVVGDVGTTTGTVIGGQTRGVLLGDDKDSLDKALARIKALEEQVLNLQVQLANPGGASS